MVSKPQAQHNFGTQSLVDISCASIEQKRKKVGYFRCQPCKGPDWKIMETQPLTNLSTELTIVCKLSKIITTDNLIATDNHLLGLSA